MWPSSEFPACATCAIIKCIQCVHHMRPPIMHAFRARATRLDVALCAVFGPMLMPLVGDLYQMHHRTNTQSQSINAHIDRSTDRPTDRPKIYPTTHSTIPYTYNIVVSLHVCIRVWRATDVHVYCICSGCSYSCIELLGVLSGTWLGLLKLGRSPVGVYQKCLCNCVYMGVPLDF